MVWAESCQPTSWFIPLVLCVPLIENNIIQMHMFPRLLSGGSYVFLNSAGREEVYATYKQTGVGILTLVSPTSSIVQPK
jgi:hypothetical protein